MDEITINIIVLYDKTVLITLDYMRVHECGEINSQSTRTKVYKFK